MLMSHQAPQEKGAKIKVVILEDGRYDRLGMTTELHAEPDIDLVCATAQPQELLAAITEHHPSVAVIDLRIYDDDTVGLETIRQIKHMAADMKIIVLTSFPELPNFLTACDLGVQAFVKKAAPSWRPALGELVRLVADGGQFYDPDLTQKMARCLNEATPAPVDPDCVPMPDNPELSARELEVLRLLAANCSNQQIADALVISKNTVKSHIRNINSKLGTVGRRSAVIIAVARGLLNPSLPETHHP